MRFAIVNKNNIVINIIELEDGSKWSPPIDCQVMGIKDDSIAEPRGEYSYLNNFIKAPDIGIPVRDKVDRLQELLVEKKIITEEEVEVSLKDEALVDKSSLFWISIIILTSLFGIYYL